MSGIEVRNAERGVRGTGAAVLDPDGAAAWPVVVIGALGTVVPPHGGAVTEVPVAPGPPPAAPGRPRPPRRRSAHAVPARQGGPVPPPLTVAELLNRGGGANLLPGGWSDGLTSGTRRGAVLAGALMACAGTIGAAALLGDGPAAVLVDLGATGHMPDLFALSQELPAAAPAPVPEVAAARPQAAVHTEPHPVPPYAAPVEPAGASGQGLRTPLEPGPVASPALAAALPELSSAVAPMVSAMPAARSGRHGAALQDRTRSARGWVAPTVTEQPHETPPAGHHAPEVSHPEPTGDGPDAPHPSHPAGPAWGDQPVAGEVPDVVPVVEVPGAEPVVDVPVVEVPGAEPVVDVPVVEVPGAEPDDDAPVGGPAGDAGEAGGDGTGPGSAGDDAGTDDGSGTGVTQGLTVGDDPQPAGGAGPATDGDAGVGDVPAPGGDADGAPVESDGGVEPSPDTDQADPTLLLPVSAALLPA